MDNELKSFQKKCLIAFSVCIFLGLAVLVMQGTSRLQRGKAMRVIEETHVKTQHRLDEIEKKLDILIAKK
jgi:hypothetical protein